MAGALLACIKPEERRSDVHTCLGSAYTQHRATAAMPFAATCKLCRLHII